MKYLETHPWIDFRCDFKNATHYMWMRLGAAQAKCKEVAHVPLRPDMADELYQIYLAKGVMATTAIEGNTLNEAQVLQQIKGELVLPESKQYLANEAQNVIEACNHIAKNTLGGDCEAITVDDILKYNEFVLKGLELDEGTIPGEIRTHSVVVGNVYRGAPPEDCEYLLQMFCDFLNNSDNFDLRHDNCTVASGILKAIIAHLYLAWIHPFGDGNGRTARLLELKILLMHGVPMPAAHLLSNYYNETRTEYYRKLRQSSQGGKNNGLIFIDYAVNGFNEGLDVQLEYIHAKLIDVSWINYIHEKFKNLTSTVDLRRKHLLLDLSNSEKAVAPSDAVVLSARVARSYMDKTQKTITRDINVLVGMNLIKKANGKIVANKSIVVDKFLPSRIETDW